MRARTVTAPDQRVWTVSIRWLPRSPRWHGWGFERVREARARRREAKREVERKQIASSDDDAEWWQLLEGAGLPFESPTGCLILVAAGLTLGLAWFFVFPVLVLLLDVLLVLLIAAGAIFSRLLFRRPWIIEAEERGRVSERSEWLVVGRPAASRTIREVATALETGWPLDRISPTEAVRAS